MTGRAIRFETRSRARDELRRAMTAIDKVKKWEKKWVAAGGPNCKLNVFKWVPKELTKEEKEIESKENQAPKEVKPEESTKPKLAPTFLPSDNNEDSRDSIGKLEFMKYCQDPDSQDSMHSIPDSEKTGFSEDQDTKQSTNSLPATDSPSATVTVADAFNSSDTPKLPSVEEPPSKKVKVSSSQLDDDNNSSMVDEASKDSMNTETNDSVES